MKYDVVIVGAGIAGLSCARVLQQNNLSFIILESGSHPGGRIQTEIINGFRLDYGFQVLQTGYPEAAKVLDYKKLVTIQLDQFLDSINAGHFPWNNSRNASVADTFCFLQVVR